ncbi:MAG TPA: alpha/beta hydrolase [Acidimicrobiales bacterium]|nr:alpha/beta hydrolase [Acidimicrobiales bacterium]
MYETREVSRGTTTLIARRWSGPPGAPCAVLLHSGVTDQRGWEPVARELSRFATVVTYDRRGYGESAAGEGPFSAVDDLLAAVDSLGLIQPWLVGSSMGGALALDAVIDAPSDFAGLVLFAPGISGAPEPDEDEIEPEALELFARVREHLAAGDLAGANRYETWLWLDGPTSPEGRVGGEAREAALVMNAPLLERPVPEGIDASRSAWDHLEEIAVPCTIVCGALDVAVQVQWCKVLAERIAGARLVQLENAAHLVYIEQPSLAVDCITQAIAATP